MRVGAPPWNAAAQWPHDDALRDAAPADAHATAGALAFERARVDLSAVASHYMGETEKHLARLFGDASASDLALGFDEADALFGRRTAVRDAHDRDATRAADDPL